MSKFSKTLIKSRVVKFLFHSSLVVTPSGAHGRLYLLLQQLHTIHGLRSLPWAKRYSLCIFQLAPRAVRGAQPLPTFFDRRAAADNLSARRRCHCCCVVILLQFSMTKKCRQKILRIERNCFGNL